MYDDMLPQSEYSCNVDCVKVILHDEEKKVVVRAKLAVPYEGCIAVIWTTVSVEPYPESHHLT